MNKKLHILQVNAADSGGGAAKVAHDLFKAYNVLGHESWLAVGKKYTHDSNVIQIPNEQAYSSWEKVNFGLANTCNNFVGKIKGAGRLAQIFKNTGRYKNYRDYLTGTEPFDYPGSRKLLELISEKPDIIHMHNLHSKYFDLRMLPELSSRVPVVMTLHDTWLLSGHCAYAKTCKKWKTGCGGCPDLTLYPAVRKDNTAYNWQQKKKIYEKSRLYIATPCQWLMNNVKKSMLYKPDIPTKVINNGVDLTIFKPGDKQKAREILGLAPDVKILLFAANSVKTNIWKDYATLKKAVGRLSILLPDKKFLFICVGDSGVPEKTGNTEIIFVPYQHSSSFMVNYYQAADVYIHAAHADTFPNVILESLACGTPVVATAVDGVPEQVKSLRPDRELIIEEESVTPVFYDQDQATGMLVSRGDHESMAQALAKLFTHEFLLEKLSHNAFVDSRMRFDQKRQVSEYLAWYDELMQDRAFFKTDNINLGFNTLTLPGSPIKPGMTQE